MIHSIKHDEDIDEVLWAILIVMLRYVLIYHSVVALSDLACAMESVQPLRLPK